MKKRSEHHIWYALAFLLLVVIGGTLGYRLIEHWDFSDAFYMTILSITTTGFSEVNPLSQNGRVFTVLLIIAGLVGIAYLGGRVAQLIIETYVFRRQSMKLKLRMLKNHYIICGYGRIGEEICEDLKDAGVSFVVIEKDPDVVSELASSDLVYVQGDSTMDEVLLNAGIKNAKGLVSVLPTDAENVFTSLSAKTLNKEIFVVARAVLEESESKLKKAGADRVVKPSDLVSRRMFQLLLRPGVVDFMDVIGKGKQFDLKMEEIKVDSSSILAGKRLLDSPIRKDLDIIIVAIYRNDGSFRYNPGSTVEILPGDRLIAIGESKNLEKLGSICGSK